MRIVDPKSFDRHPKSKPRNKIKRIKPFIILLIVLLPIVGYVIFESTQTETPAVVSTSFEYENVVENEIDTPETESGLRIFGGNEFRLLYDNLLLPNTEKVDTPPLISGDDIADARIRQLAELRGYKLRNDVDILLPTIDGYQLQEVAHVPWKQMQTEAADDGIYMTIVSAYRSIKSQRELFVSRLQAEGVSIVDVANGTADAEVTQVLITSAVPGYSKHHSGYTIDLLCSGWIFENFKNSPCNEWLFDNNYENAKKFGFIPSYPLDADLQGPEPEAWEYVYVGIDLLSY